MISSAGLLLAVVVAAAEPVAPSEDQPASAAEEAKGAGAGVAPVELIPRLEFRQLFAQLPDGSSAHVTTTEIDIQFLNRLLLRYEGTIEVLRAPTGQISGLGDAQVAAIVMLAASPRFVAVVIGGAVLDTASQPALGAGKTQLVFGGGAAWKPLRWWLPYVLVQEYLAVAGDSARPDINQALARVGNIAFGPGFAWLKLDLDTLIDFANDQGAFFARLEAGRLLIGRVGLFMRSGTQLLGTRQLDYTLEVGVRYLFRLGAGK
jgi:hypothetical protein